MTISPKIVLILRLALGWIFFYAGITKILDSSWSAAGLLNSAQTFSSIFHWFANPGVLPVINFINEWALLLLGISLILGIFVRLSSSLGIALMVLYYFVQLNFPYIGKGFLIDQHVIFILLLAMFIHLRAGMAWGLDAKLCKKK